MQIRFRNQGSKEATHVIENVDWVEPFFSDEDNAYPAYVEYGSDDDTHIIEVSVYGDFILNGITYDYMTIHA